jgi:hypothetical protein
VCTKATPQINIRGWRIINTIVFGIGLVTPWILFELDAYSLPATPGWEFILATWLGVWDDFSVNEFDLRMWPFWLMGFSGVLLILYITLNIYLIAKDVSQKGNKLFSLILLGVAGALLFHVLIGDRPLLGYWLMNLGLLSSAILEWTNVDMNLRTRK